MDSQYIPKQYEKDIYDFWLKKRLFHSEPDGRPNFVIVIPPPNITGSLHMGHALNNTLQDVLIRYHKLLGINTEWMPGTDHGGIATQNVLEKELKKEGKNRHAIGREEFLARMKTWASDTKGTIMMQLARLGSSLDWDRERFTMDEVCSKAVLAAFTELFSQGYIYRGFRMINWCPRCSSALSDLEVEYDEEKGSLYFIRYPFADDRTKYLIVATTRPETMLGDTAVAYNPDDERYKIFAGKKLILPLMEREILLIADSYVDKEFGTGLVKITPAHDPNDNEVAKRHNLASVQVINDRGEMTVLAGKEYAGLDRYKARKKILEDLEKQGLMEKIETYTLKAGKCYRCATVIEPLEKEQWFVKMKYLAEQATFAAEANRVRFYPASWKRPFLLWLENIHDWCISRHIWWGHRIPVWYCLNCQNGNIHINLDESKIKQYDGRSNLLGGNPIQISSFYKISLQEVKDIILDYHLEGITEKDNGVLVSENIPEKCPHCGGTDFLQDPDVLDTWFSSALWPFSTFGWPGEAVQSAKNKAENEDGNKSCHCEDGYSAGRGNLSLANAKQDLKYYYPTTTLVTGHEILYLWVARMVMMGLHFMKDVPFSKVFLNGIVRDSKGKKMSKSLGNVIDPIGIMDEYGTDALRFSLAKQSVLGRDLTISTENFISARNFMNKLWNSSRFIIMRLAEQNTAPQTGEGPAGASPRTLPSFTAKDLMDRWIYAELSDGLDSIKTAYDEYEISRVSREAYEFIWHKYCDWYIELTKEHLEEKKENLIFLLVALLKMVHPVMPYITEVIWQKLKEYAPLEDSIMESRFPELKKEDYFAAAKSEMALIIEIVTALRTLRSELDIKPKDKTDAVVSLVEKNAGYKNMLDENGSYIKNLAKVEKLTVGINLARPEKHIVYNAPGFDIFVPFSKETIDLAGLIAKLKKTNAKDLEFLEALKKKLQNPKFIEFAPEEARLTGEKIILLDSKIQRLNQNIAILESA